MSAYGTQGGHNERVSVCWLTATLRSAAVCSHLSLDDSRLVNYYNKSVSRRRLLSVIVSCVLSVYAQLYGTGLL